MDKFTQEEAREIDVYLRGDGTYPSEKASYKLYCYLLPEMPYGVAKARTGTPDEFYEHYFYRYSENEFKDWLEKRTQKGV